MGLKITLSVMGAILITYMPYIILFIGAYVGDSMAKRRAMKAPRAQQAKLLQESTHRVKDTRELLAVSYQDPRLIGLTRTVKDDEGNVVKDDEGNPKKEYILEKYDNHGWGIPVSPDKTALTYKQVYMFTPLICILVSFLFCMVGFYWGLLVSCIAMSILVGFQRKTAQEVKTSQEGAWTRLSDIYSLRVQPLGDKNIHDVVKVTEWVYDGELLTIANARVKASTDGLSKELEDIVGKKDSQGRPIQAKIARFRDIPNKMEITLPTNFMASSQDMLMKHINQVFGTSSAWIAGRETTNKNGNTVLADGWDYRHGVVYLMAVPPLPSSAPTPEDIDETPPNTIRLGRTTDGEAVWDLTGQGFAKGDTIHKSKFAGIPLPMGLVPLDVNTNIWVLENSESRYGTENLQDFSYHGLHLTPQNIEHMITPRATTLHSEPETVFGFNGGLRVEPFTPYDKEVLNEVDGVSRRSVVSVDNNLDIETFGQEDNQ